MGGDGKGTNPEQLFAVGYAACFTGSLGVVAERDAVTLPSDTQIDSKVGIGPQLVDKAHEVCPHSNATRGNIPVDITVN